MVVVVVVVVVAVANCNDQYNTHVHTHNHATMMTLVCFQNYHDNFTKDTSNHDDKEKKNEEEEEEEAEDKIIIIQHSDWRPGRLRRPAPRGLELQHCGVQRAP